MSSNLSPHQQTVYDLLDRANGDVSIRALYVALYGCPGGRTVREMQQRLGPLLRRLNSKLSDRHISPGHLKQTYRMDPVST